MNKEEILTNEFIENENVQHKSHKKIKIAVAITASLALIAITTLLVGHFKFDWFKSEIYEIDAKINRNVYQASYFTETKTIKSKIGFTNGMTEEHEATIYTNFMVFMIDKVDFLNTAALIILDAKVKSLNELKDLIKFDIFDEEKVKEVISNPDGSKYPLAFFKFYENGTIDEILLPNNMDQYNAQSIVDLIKNVIPKLTRNRTEDISNGLEIKTQKGKKNHTLVESHSPRELENFRDSKFAKTIERVVENEKLTSIKTNSNLDLETKLEEGESAFGLKSFNYEQKSKIISTSTMEEKEKAELFIKLSKHFTMIKSKDLLESFSKKEEPTKEPVVEEMPEDDSKLRKLGFPYNGDTTFVVKTYNTLGGNVYIKVRFGCTGGSAFGYVIVQTSAGTAQIGTSGVQGSRTWSSEATLFTFPFGPIPGVSMNLKAGGSLTVSASLDYSNNLKITLSGSLYAKAQVTAGYDKVASISGGAKGTFLTASMTGTLNSSGASRSGSFSAGTVVAYAEGKTLGYQAFYHEVKVFDGWTVYV